MTKTGKSILKIILSAFLILRRFHWRSMENNKVTLHTWLVWIEEDIFRKFILSNIVCFQPSEFKLWRSLGSFTPFGDLILKPFWDCLHVDEQIWWCDWHLSFSHQHMRIMSWFTSHNQGIFIWQLSQISSYWGIPSQLWLQSHYYSFCHSC